MYFKNVTIDELYQALTKTNEQYENNLVWLIAPFHKSRKILSARLATVSLDGPGSRWHLRTGSWDGQYKNGKRSKYACWHVHGDFFVNLLEINSEVIIKSGGKEISRYGGNWQDERKSGGFTFLGTPFKYSDSCRCNLRAEIKKVIDMPREELTLHLHDFQYEQSKRVLEQRLRGKECSLELSLK